MNKKTVMISQPMGRLTKEEILKTRKEATEFLESEGYEVLDTYFKDTKRSALDNLGRSISAMADADIVYFVPGWEKARGCLIERQVAEAYGLIIYTADGPCRAWDHRQICDELNHTYQTKNRAYGDSFGISFRKYGKISALTRMSDKWNRIETLMTTDTADNGESLSDSLLDLANYCIMTVMELDYEKDREN